MKKNLNRIACIIVAILSLASVSCKKKDSSSSPAYSNKPKVYLLTKLIHNSVETTYTYDDNNRLISELSNYGSMTFFQYDGAGHIIKSGTVDKSGRTNPYVADTTSYYTFEYKGDNVVAYDQFNSHPGSHQYTETGPGTYDYSNDGKIVTANFFVSGSNATWKGFGADTVTFDSLNNIVKFVDNYFGDTYSSTVYQYDQKHAAFNNPAHVKFPLILQKFYGANNMTQVTISDKDGVHTSTYTYQYNADGYPTSMTANEYQGVSSGNITYTDTYQYTVR